MQPGHARASFRADHTSERTTSLSAIWSQRAKVGTLETVFVPTISAFYGIVIRMLRDPVLFAQVEVDEFGETIRWSNGADLDPDVLYGTFEPDTGPAPRVSIPRRAGA
jgi:hypothetical protein